MQIDVTEVVGTMMAVVAVVVDLSGRASCCPGSLPFDSHREKRCWLAGGRWWQQQ
jgi:hypothetical protein